MIIRQNGVSKKNLILENKDLVIKIIESDIEFVKYDINNLDENKSNTLFFPLFNQIIKKFEQIILKNHYQADTTLENLEKYETLIKELRNIDLLNRTFKYILQIVLYSLDEKFSKSIYMILLQQFNANFNFNRIENSKVIKNDINILMEELKKLEKSSQKKDNELNSQILEKKRLENEISILRESYEKTLKDELEYREKLHQEKMQLENELELKKLEYENKFNEEKIELENKYKDKRKEEIKKAIDILKKPANELIIENGYNKERRKYFTNLSEIIFTVAGILFISYVYIVYFHYIKTNQISTLTLTVYIFSIFPIIFSTLIGFLFLRQANIKSNEIKDIDKKFVLIHDINNSLLALLELKENINDKTEEIIDKLINNILTYDKTTNNERNDDISNLIEFNNLLSKLNLNSFKNKDNN